jgi:GTPase SAR1 family protein
MKFSKNEPMGDTAKKLVLIGPMASGKTTFKRIFFEDINPLQLLKSSLEPTRGVETSAYKLFSETLAVWDLAGQEIEEWLGNQKDVFDNSKVIVCMLSASDALKETVTFLFRFLKVQLDVAPGTRIFILLNKCDLISNIDVYNRLVNIEQYMSLKHPEFAQVCRRTNIYRTSIVDAYFLRTVMVANKIIEATVESASIRFEKEQFSEIRQKMAIVLGFVKGLWYSLEDIAKRANLPLERAKDYLDDLQDRCYVEIQPGKKTIFAISEKGEHLSMACKKQSALIKTREAKQSIGLFLNLKNV